jgi:putative oxidoreductase
MSFRSLVRWIPALLILLFAYTGCSKLFDLSGFTHTLYNQPIPRFAVPTLAILLPGMEIATAACLLFDRTRMTGLIASLILLIIFTLYIGAILLGLFHRVPCSCGGIFRGLSWQQHLWVNLGLLAFAIVALRYHIATSHHSTYPYAKV